MSEIFGSLFSSVDTLAAEMLLTVNAATTKKISVLVVIFVVSREDEPSLSCGQIFRK